MALPAAFVLVQADAVEIQLALELEEALRRSEPDGPGRGLDAGDDLGEELLIEIGRRDVRARRAGRHLQTPRRSGGYCSCPLGWGFWRVRRLRGGTHRNSSALSKKGRI